MFKKKVDNRAKMTVYEDGTVEMHWTPKSNFMEFGTVLALLTVAQMDEIVVSALYNKGLEMEHPADNVRAQHIRLRMQDQRNLIMGAVSQVGDEEPPAVDAEDAFAGEDELED